MAEPCDHGNRPTITTQEFARLLEGGCPSCEVAAERTDDGFALCPCCRIAWRVDGETALVRLVFEVVDEDGEPVSIESGTPSKENERG